MRFPIKTTIALLVVGSVGGAAYTFLPGYMRELSKPRYRTAAVTRGDIVSMVNATGTIKPVLSISVGSFVSGPIKEILVDFNAEVKKGQVLAKIDERIYDANYKRDLAQLETRKAELERIEALLQQAKNDEKRAIALKEQNENFISGTEMDQFRFNRLSLEAQLKVAKANIETAEANLKNSEANLKYCEILSPVDGRVIDRKVDPGQTLASQFQTPELFIVAPDMRSKMHIIATVDEADIGMVRKAEAEKRPVQFTVDAYGNDLFEGFIEQVRWSSKTEQNVVTYPVVVAAPNPDLKLMPGMTASLSFQVDEVKNVLRIPNAALRFYPQRHLVRPEDHKILDGVTKETTTEDTESVQTKLTAMEKAEARKNRHRRHVWVREGDLLRAIEVETGLSDNHYTQLISGDLKEDQELVTGVLTFQ